MNALTTKLFFVMLAFTIHGLHAVKKTVALRKITNQTPFRITCTTYVLARTENESHVQCPHVDTEFDIPEEKTAPIKFVKSTGLRAKEEKTFIIEPKNIAWIRGAWVTVNPNEPDPDKRDAQINGALTEVNPNEVELGYEKIQITFEIEGRGTYSFWLTLNHTGVVCMTEPVEMGYFSGFEVNGKDLHLQINDPTEEWRCDLTFRGDSKGIFYHIGL